MGGCKEMKERREMMFSLCMLRGDYRLLGEEGEEGDDVLIVYA